MLQYRLFGGHSLPPGLEGFIKAGANIGSVIGQFAFGTSYPHHRSCDPGIPRSSSGRRPIAGEFEHPEAPSSFLRSSVGPAMVMPSTARSRQLVSPVDPPWARTSGQAFWPKRATFRPSWTTLILPKPPYFAFGIWEDGVCEDCRRSCDPQRTSSEHLLPRRREKKGNVRREKDESLTDYPRAQVTPPITSAGKRFVSTRASRNGSPEGWKTERTFQTARSSCLSSSPPSALSAIPPVCRKFRPAQRHTGPQTLLLLFLWRISATGVLWALQGHPCT